MTIPLTLEDLEKQGLVPFSHGGYALGYIYADPRHPEWQGCPDKTMRHLATLKNSGYDVSAVPFYRRVKDPSGYTAPYYQLDQFKWRKEFRNYKSGGKWIFKFDPMLSKEKNTQKTERGRSLRSTNQLIRRLYMTGSQDKLIFCPIINRNIDNQTIAGKFIDNLTDAHHIVCYEGGSLQKDGEDPGKRNSSTDLWKPSAKSREAVEDLMRTILVSRTGHHIIHKWYNSDITWYKVNGFKLPWALRCKTNYNKFTNFLVRKIGYEPFPSYDNWVETLTLEYHGKPRW